MHCEKNAHIHWHSNTAPSSFCYNNVWWCLILTILNQIPTTQMLLITVLLSTWNAGLRLSHPNRMLTCPSTKQITKESWGVPLLPWWKSAAWLRPSVNDWSRWNLQRAAPNLWKKTTLARQRIRTQTQLVVVSCAKFNKVAEYRTMKVELQTQPGDITCWESAVVAVEHNELFPASTWVWREDNQSSRKVARAYTHPFWPCGCGLAAQLKIHENPLHLTETAPGPTRVITSGSIQIWIVLRNRRSLAKPLCL